MKKFIASLFVAVISALCVTGASAQDGGTTEVKTLRVNMKDGGVHKFRLPDSPIVTFKGENMEITSAGMQGSYARADVSHFDFVIDKQSSIDAASMNPDDFTLSFTDNANVVLASPRLTKVDLYDTAGRKIASLQASDGKAVVAVGHLAPGAYLVSPDCHPAVKIVKR